jgi:hypothetical protein
MKMSGQRELPLSLMARSAAARLLAVAVVIAGLWLAIAWAVSLP